MTLSTLHPLLYVAGGTYYPVSGDAIACSDTARARAAAAAAIRNTPALLAEARGWIDDAYPIGDGAAGTLTPPAVCRVLERGYSGGCIEFYLNSLQLTPTITRKA